MQATETDFAYPQSTDQVERQVDGIAGGIMDLLDNPDPNSSGEAIAKDVTDTTTVVKDTTEPEPPVETPSKVTLKWQGQEREVTQEELLALAQQGFDYTKKTQSLAEERDQLAPYVGFIKAVQSDPAKAQLIAAILAGQQPQPTPEKKFDDPIEQLKWETKQEAVAEIRRELQQNIAPLQRQQALNEVRMQVQSDPDYQVVHNSIIDLVKSQPPTVQRMLYMQLDQNPQAYLEAFQHFKSKLSKPPETPIPAKRETKAPILEAGGISPPDGLEARDKRQRIDKQKAKALRSGDPTEIGEWLRTSGAIDHLY